MHYMIKKSNNKYIAIRERIREICVLYSFIMQYYLSPHLLFMASGDKYIKQ